jgi:hypothetical protein
MFPASLCQVSEEHGGEFGPGGVSKNKLEQVALN